MLYGVHLRGVVMGWRWDLAQQPQSLPSCGGQLEGRERPPLPQLVSNHSRSALALRAARAALQRWRGFLDLGHTASPGQQQCGQDEKEAAAGGEAVAAAAAAGSSAAAAQAPSPPKPTKPLTQKQLRQQAASAAKQQQAAAAKAAAAAAEQRRERQRLQAAEAAAAMKRAEMMKAYKPGGFPLDVCSPLVCRGLWYCLEHHFDRLCRAALQDPERTAALVDAALNAEACGERLARDDGGAGGGVAMSEEWWRLALQCVGLMAADADRLLWSPEKIGSGVQSVEMLVDIDCESEDTDSACFIRTTGGQAVLVGPWAPAHAVFELSPRPS